MSLEDSTGSRRTAREQQSLFSRYQDDAEGSGALRVEVGADGRGTGVELGLPDPEAEESSDGITAPYDPCPGLHGRMTPGKGRLHFRLVPERTTFRLAHVGSKRG
ncbi:hypothetical protein ABZ915_32905 [Streptomyces sp. NPDC046915]|uniref:hypothetical protein n=1 Tax=Streptomyces sp. NPDC046915 TaxID=3155257 RepID=UPI0033EF2002